MKFNFKYVVIGFVILYAIVTLLFFNFYKSLAIKDTKYEASAILNNMNAIRSYVKDIQRPFIYTVIDNVHKDKYFNPKFLSSTYISQYIYEEQLKNKELKYTYKLVATNPLNPIHTATKFEAEILEKFRRNEAKDYFSIIEENDTSYFFIAKPIARNVSSCLQCHGDPKIAPISMINRYGDTLGYHEKIGDLRAMIYLKVPIIDIIAKHQEEFITGGSAMLIVFIIFIILMYSIYKKNMKLQDRKDKLFQHQNRLAVMGSMIGNISHQWKQPLSHLSNILINLELLNERDKLTKEKVHEKVENANEQITFMADTIDDFKNFFSPKNSEINCTIKQIIHQSKKLWQASLNKHKIDLIVEIEDNFVFFGSKNEIVQIFINIINNAKDAFLSNNIENRMIKIKAFKKDNQKIVTFENNAGNIEKEVIDKIFKQYFSTKDLSIATGIGLYISKVIIENYNGTIDVKNIDDGVIFTINFGN